MLSSAFHFLSLHFQVLLFSLSCFLGSFKADGAVQWERWMFSTLLCVSIMQGGENPGRGSNVAGRDSLTLAESLMNGKPSLS